MIAVIQASLGGFDDIEPHVPQTLVYDYFKFTDENFPPRSKAMTARLQAKIPKILGYQLIPYHEYILWIDGNLSLNNQDTLNYLFNQIQGYDILTLRHPRRPNIRQEIRYLRKGLREQSRYLVSRYDGEHLKDQTEEYEKADFEDDLLVLGGIFLYRNTPEVQAMLKEWFYQVCRYNVQDQISFSYVLKKSGLKIKVLDHIYNEWDYLKHTAHARRYM